MKGSKFLDITEHDAADREQWRKHDALDWDLRFGLVWFTNSPSNVLKISPHPSGESTLEEIN